LAGVDGGGDGLEDGLVSYDGWTPDEGDDFIFWSLGV